MSEYPPKRECQCKCRACEDEKKEDYLFEALFATAMGHIQLGALNTDFLELRIGLDLLPSDRSPKDVTEYQIWGVRFPIVYVPGDKFEFILKKSVDV